MKKPKDKKSATKSSREENKTSEYDIGDILHGMERRKKIDTSESDLTEDDLIALGPVDLSMDGGDDEGLLHRDQPVDFAGKDLVVPGSELDDEAENIGSEDEENNAYSRGDTL